MNLFLDTSNPFNGFYPRTTWVRRQQKGQPFWILLEQEMMGWQWHQLDNMQIICTSLQTETTPVPYHSVLQARWPSCRQTNSVKALKALAELETFIGYIQCNCQQQAIL